MDNLIPQKVIKQRRKRIILKRSFIGVGMISVLIVLINILKPSISRKNIVTSDVDAGDLSISISAIGKVLPLYEEVITSPISSKILQVYRKFGDKLQVGDSILKLDLASFYTDVEKQRDELELKHLQLDQFKVEAQRALEDVSMQITIDEMKLQRMKVALKNEVYLDSIGASTPDKVKQITLEYKIQVMQLEQLKQKFKNQQKKALIDIKTKELDYKFAKNSANLLNKMITEAEVRTPRAATLTWVNDQVGTSVNIGAQLAIVSDLENFKIEGELSDNYSNKISIGQRVEVKLGDEILMGTIGSIVPAVSNGKVKFNVILDVSNHERLRAGLKVDLYIINSIQENVKRIDNYSYYTGPGVYYLWVINQNKAIKKKVILGESSSDKVEVIEGLDIGNTVIISDMTRYLDKNKINIE